MIHLKIYPVALVISRGTLIRSTAIVGCLTRWVSSLAVSRANPMASKWCSM